MKKVDRTLLYTSFLYGFSFILTFLRSLEVIPEQNTAGLVIIRTFVYFFSSISCAVLSFYALQVLSVKILLESESHKILARRAKRHQHFVILYVTLLATVLITNSTMAALSDLKWDSLSFTVYRSLTLFVLIRVVLTLPFFIKQRNEKVKDASKAVNYWIISLAVMNVSHQVISLVKSFLTFL